MRNTVLGLHHASWLARAKAAFIECRSVDAIPRRQAEIGALPTVTWKSVTLYTLRCHGVTGKGPHLVNLPEALLWCLIDLRAYRCPFHA